MQIFYCSTCGKRLKSDEVAPGASAETALCATCKPKPEAQSTRPVAIAPPASRRTRSSGAHALVRGARAAPRGREAHPPATGKHKAIVAVAGGTVLLAVGVVSMLALGKQDRSMPSDPKKTGRMAERLARRSTATEPNAPAPPAEPAPPALFAPVVKKEAIPHQPAPAIQPEPAPPASPATPATPEPAAAAPAPEPEPKPAMPDPFPSRPTEAHAAEPEPQAKPESSPSPESKPPAGAGEWATLLGENAGLDGWSKGTKSGKLAFRDGYAYLASAESSADIIHALPPSAKQSWEIELEVYLERKGNLDIHLEAGFLVLNAGKDGVKESEWNKVRLSVRGSELTASVNERSVQVEGPKEKFLQPVQGGKIRLYFKATGKPTRVRNVRARAIE